MHPRRPIGLASGQPVYRLLVAGGNAAGRKLPANFLTAPGFAVPHRGETGDFEKEFIWNL